MDAGAVDLVLVAGTRTIRMWLDLGGGGWGKGGTGRGWSQRAGWRAGWRAVHLAAQEKPEGEDGWGTWKEILLDNLLSCCAIIPIRDVH